MTHTKRISRELPAKALAPFPSMKLATLLPNWPATPVDLANILWDGLVVQPAAKVFGFDA